MPRGVPKAGQRKPRATAGLDGTLKSLTDEITRKANKLTYHKQNNADKNQQVDRPTFAFLR